MGRVGVWLGALMLAFATLAAPARAQGAAETRCSATGEATDTVAQTLSRPLQWRCPADFEDLSQSRQVVRFVVDPSAPPRFAVSRIAAFESLSVAWREDGEIRFDTTPFADLKPTWFDRQFALPLPDFPVGTREIFLVVDNTTQSLPLDYLRLERAPPGSSDADRDALLLTALLLGLLLMPLLFDTAFYRVLREPFILWHAAFVLCMAAQLVLTTGLYLPLVEPGLLTLRALTVTSFALMVVAAGMFLATFVEPGMISTRMRRALYVAAGAMLAAAAFHAPGFTVLGKVPATIFYASGLPISVTYITVAWMAWRKGSRMVRWIALGFSPLVVVALVRVFSFLLPGVPTAEATDLFLVGMVIEVSATALGVATRFLQLKNERDRAKSEARSLESLAGRDPLTGLMNRRAVEPRFAQLHRDGYDTFALFDLDHFKSVNDVHGHAVGDAVLRATAEALRGDSNAIAMRLGGEEFLVLLRGTDAEGRAERLRLAIPARVASEVAGLGRLVTASMGLVVAPHRAMPRARFKDVYVMADKLLYEAKAQGRNRSLSQRVQGFGKPRQERRKVA